MKPMNPARSPIQKPSVIQTAMNAAATSIYTIQSTALKAALSALQMMTVATNKMIHPMSP